MSKLRSIFSLLSYLHDLRAAIYVDDELFLYVRSSLLVQYIIQKNIYITSSFRMCGSLYKMVEAKCSIYIATSLKTHNACTPFHPNGRSQEQIPT